MLVKAARENQDMKQAVTLHVKWYFRMEFYSHCDGSEMNQPRTDATQERVA